MTMNRRDLFKVFGATAVAGVAASADDLEREGSSWDRGLAAEDSLLTRAPRPVDYDKITYVQVDPKKCKNCDKCLPYCPTGILRDAKVGKVHEIPAPDGCMHCGQCLTHCTRGAIFENSSFVTAIKTALSDPSVVTAAIVAPAVRYGIMEAFGGDGAYAAGRLVSALRKLGFDFVWDNQFGADVTIWEEATELLTRVRKEVSKPLPQLTSCCPGWVKYVESFYPSLLPNLSSCKSPFGMMGALSKTYGAQKNNIEPFKLFTVAITPCIAKKFEASRPEMNDSGYRDIDAVLDSRELIAMIKGASIDVATLPDGTTDPFLGSSSGGGTLFAVTGGVMESALRYAHPHLNPGGTEIIEFQAVRGMTGVRSADVQTANGVLKVAVVAGLANAKPICDAIVAGTSPYQFIEVMACMGGCVNGGGQPIPSSRSTLLRAFHSLTSKLTSLV